MNSFVQHIPAFARDGKEPPEPRYPFETTEELLALPVVQRRTYSTPDRPFSHFAMSDDALIAVYRDGFEWWVVGFVSEPQAVQLPRWEGWKHLARLSDGREVVLTSEVVSACGGRLRLRDGTEAIDVLFERQDAKNRRDKAFRDRGVCPVCETPYRRELTFNDNGMTRVESFCDPCGGGWRMTHWEPAKP